MSEAGRWLARGWQCGKNNLLYGFLCTFFQLIQFNIDAGCLYLGRVTQTFQNASNLLPEHEKKIEAKQGPEQLGDGGNEFCDGVHGSQSSRGWARPYWNGRMELR